MLLINGSRSFLLEADFAAYEFATSFASQSNTVTHFNMEPTSLIDFPRQPYRWIHARMVVEVVERGLEDLSENDLATMIENLHLMRESGLKIAMDDTTWTKTEKYIIEKIHPDFIKTVDWHNLARSRERVGQAKIIAEMIENNTLARVARTLGADYLQGFYFPTPKIAVHISQVINGSKTRSVA